MGGWEVGRNRESVVRAGSTEKGVKSLSEGYIWEGFQAEETGSATALRGPGGFQNSEAAVAEHRTKASWCHSGCGEPQQGFEQRRHVICRATKAEAGRNRWDFPSVFLTFHNGHILIL